MNIEVKQVKSAPMALDSVIMVFWKETAFPLLRAMCRRWNKNVVSLMSSFLVSSVIIIIFFHSQGAWKLAKCSVCVWNGYDGDSEVVSELARHTAR